MSIKKVSALFGIVLAAALLAACAGGEGAEGPAGPPGPEGPAGPPGDAGMADLTCTECHDDTSLITGKKAAWSETVHGEGEAYVRGTSSGCAGCHSGGAFTAMVAAGHTPDMVEAGDPDPTRQDCRACHNIHTTYTAEDWSLTTTDPVTLYAFEDATFDGGAGNLCANCHQPRRVMEAEGGIVNVSSTHWGPHHGPQSAMMLGVGGAGEVEGSASVHANLVEDTCVTCHLGEGDSHTFAPSVAACTACHGEIESLDVNGVQTEVAALIAELEELLLAKGMLAEDELPPEADYLIETGVLHVTGHPHPVPGDYPEAEAAALWNYIFVSYEDSSHGVHNPAYTIALLEASIAAVQ